MNVVADAAAADVKNVALLSVLLIVSSRKRQEIALTVLNI